MSDDTRTGCWSAPPLQVRDLACGHDGHRVLTQVEVTLVPGEVVHLVGANGTGKSTFLSTVAGRLPLIAGEVSVCGHVLDPEEVTAKRHLGYADDEDLAFPFLTPREHLRLVARLHGLPRDAADELLAELRGTALAGHAGVPVRSCSRGTRRQLDLAAATLHRPCLLVLDEAFDGLDRDTAALWGDRVRALASLGTAVLFSAHTRDQVEMVQPSRELRLSAAPSPSPNAHDLGVPR